jgi:ABC-type glucose/galactose transport system permease subunit
MATNPKISREGELKAIIQLEKRDKKSFHRKIQLGLIGVMVLLYAFDKLYFDSALYFIWGGFDSVTDPDNPWLPGFRAGLGTFLASGFIMSAIVAALVAWQGD